MGDFSNENSSHASCLQVVEDVVIDERVPCRCARKVKEADVQQRTTLNHAGLGLNDRRRRWKTRAERKELRKHRARQQHGKTFVSNEGTKSTNMAVSPLHILALLGYLTCAMYEGGEQRGERVAFHSI